MHLYLLFHSLTEIASATISFGTFLFAWNTRRFQNSYLLTMGAAAFFVGVFEAMHCLAFPGMTVFPSYDSNLSPQLWLCARLFQAGGSLLGLMLIRRAVRPRWLLGGFGIAFAALCAAVFLRKLPDVVLVPAGLTNFKVAAEWTLAMAFIACVALLFRVRDTFSPRVFRLLAAQGITMAACEICFTLYAQPYDFSNLLGHVLILVGGSLQYMAILLAGLTDPSETHFRELTQAKDRLELAQSAGRIGTFEWNLTTLGTMSMAGMAPVHGKMPGRSAGDFEAWWNRVYPDDRDRLEHLLKEVVTGRAEYDTEYRIIRPDGSVHWVAARGRIQRDRQGRPARLLGVNMDVTERKRGEEALRESELRFRLALRNTPVSVTAQDRELRYIWAYNQRGMHPDEIIGKVDAEIFTPGEAARLTAIKQRVLNEKIELRDQMWLDRPGGRMFVDVCFEPVRDAAGNVVGVGTASVDLTPMKMAETTQQALLRERETLLESERSARSDAEHANRLKDEFLANLSHELRTPLNAILGWSEILRRGKAEPRIVGKALDVIERNARVQTQLISDLLDVSRIISGKIRLDTKNCDPAAALEAALDSISPAAEAKQIRIEKMIEPLPCPMLGDPSRLQQVFWNLLSNAVKFTPEGGRVQVELRRKDSRIEIVFRDTGKGINPDFLPHIFERFRQGDSSASKQHAGLGLGLAIVKHLVELHGGTVQAESPGEDLGTTFTISMPALAAARQEDPGPRRIDAVSDIYLNGVKILVVDDEVDTRDILKDLLEERGAEVSLAGSAGDAVVLVREMRPDVLVADIGMPGEDGYRMIRRIRELPPGEGGQTPAVALTAYARIEDRTRAMLAGFQYHLAKPVEAAELITTLGMITRRLPKAQPRFAAGLDGADRSGAAE